MEDAASVALDFIRVRANEPGGEEALRAVLALCEERALRARFGARFSGLWSAALSKMEGGQFEGESTRAILRWFNRNWARTEREWARKARSARGRQPTTAALAYARYLVVFEGVSYLSASKVTRIPVGTIQKRGAADGWNRKRKRVKLREARRLVVEAGVPYREAAARSGAPLSTIQKHAAAEGWRGLRSRG